MKISLRGWLVIGTFAAVVCALVALNSPLLKAADTGRAAGGQLTEASLGNLLGAMGLETKKVDQRYDFTFKAVHNKEEWDLSMTAVLSQDGSSVWVMAWLDECPRSAADVPRTALLRLLSDNDRMGNGKFFAYVASNRRFVLQRVIPNENITTAYFRGILQDLGGSVVQTYPHWAVANWKRSTEPTDDQSDPGSAGKPRLTGRQTPSTNRRAVRSAVNDSKYTAPLRK